MTPQLMKTVRGALGALLTTLVAVTFLAAPAQAAPFQILKTFDTDLVGSATVEFTIEQKLLGVWVAIPCIDERGSCSLTFSNVAAGTEFVLGDAAEDSWMKGGGEFYIKEVTPPGWGFGVSVTGGTFIDFSRDKKEVHFSFEPDTEGAVTLINYPPVTAPEPATIGLLGIGLAAAMSVRRFRRSSK